MKNIGNGLLALNHDALRTTDVLRIAKQVLMKSIHVEHSDSSKVVGEGNGRQAHCLLQVLFTSAVANGSLEGAGTGCSVGCALGGLDGEEDGCGIGGSDGSTDGRGDGGGVGPSDGTGVGSGVGGGSWTSKKIAGASSFAALPLVVELREGGCSLSMA